MVKKISLDMFEVVKMRVSRRIPSAPEMYTLFPQSAEKIEASEMQEKQSFSNEIMNFQRLLKICYHCHLHTYLSNCLFRWSAIPNPYHWPFRLPSRSTW